MSISITLTVVQFEHFWVVEIGSIALLSSLFATMRHSLFIQFEYFGDSITILSVCFLCVTVHPVPSSAGARIHAAEATVVCW